MDRDLMATVGDSVRERSAVKADDATLVQTKLAVGPAEDEFEREADDVAEMVVAAIHAPGIASRGDGGGGRIRRSVSSGAVDRNAGRAASRIQRRVGRVATNPGVSIQRLLDPAQSAKLVKARQELVVILQTLKGTGKRATARKAKIADLRATVGELEAADQVAPDTSLAADAPAPGGQLAEEAGTGDSTAEAEASAPALKPIATDPSKQTELDGKVARLAELEALDSGAQTDKQKKRIAALSKAIALLTAPEAARLEVETPAVESEAEVVAPMKVEPDLAAESLRSTEQELSALVAKGPPRRKGPYNKKVAALRTKKIELEEAVARQYPSLVAAVGNVAAQELTNGYGGVPQAEVKIATWGANVVQDLVSVFTGPELKVFESKVGVVRFADLVTAKGLPGSALQAYEPVFLKKFPGANDRTWLHLATIDYNKKSEITGGHDKKMFEDFAAAKGVVVNSRVDKGDFVKVTYTTTWADGSRAADGVKTLIPDLIANKATWMADANEALWNAIAKKEFDPSKARWTGSTRSGDRFEGFYRNGKIDTFFPVV